MLISPKKYLQDTEAVVRVSHWHWNLAQTMHEANHHKALVTADTRPPGTPVSPG